MLPLNSLPRTAPLTYQVINIIVNTESTIKYYQITNYGDSIPRPLSQHAPQLGAVHRTAVGRAALFFFFSFLSAGQLTATDREGQSLSRVRLGFSLSFSFFFSFLFSLFFSLIFYSLINNIILLFFFSFLFLFFFFSFLFFSFQLDN